MKSTILKLASKIGASSLIVLLTLMLYSFTATTEYTATCDKSNSNRCAMLIDGGQFYSTGALTVVVP
ncbi:hypothetical protein QF042_003797 [Pedobacter sp. W3I1]|uniref:hypothetical protein n=1 Tax=Pedobacter sp. W3I1 TaxID=3042291 RepID=UPI002787053C|nr:hypothetical protein [Pedobacter sp. W3I1]MDQ0640232.1 hypothetical protein [Pedobacter sp. W3I1]